ncbi:MAG: TIGR04053 family radical SAM/SPASM domain-containing protein [archaeon]|nr:TIGR04053 family radical SAM/SPASM domain-containing protein [archaeon]
MNFESKPLLVFWETTRACNLSCVHCRASAITEPLPGELSTIEGMKLIDQVASFGKPYPTIIFTGGDPLKRKDLFELISYAARLGIGFALSPAVTDLVTPEILCKVKSLGASSISISLDGASHETHDSIRGREGTFEKTVETIQTAVRMSLNSQINTSIMKRNYQELPQIFRLIRGLSIKTWELFFLVRVGRGTSVQDLTPEEYESVCNFLYDASRYGIIIRCVEAPFIRRVAAERNERGSNRDCAEYQELRAQLEGQPMTQSTIRPRGTLDGDGIVFVAYDGAIQPGGLLPVELGNSKNDDLVEVYRSSELLRRIRQRDFKGYCGACEYKEVCGGSRARAFSYSGDPLSSDPACLWSFGRS